MSVAVIIPNLNCAQWLARCLDSVDAQTVRADEVIVVDGCSTDNSIDIVRVQILRSIPPPRYSFICTPPLGMANARNIGIAATSADFIVPLDADDWIEPEYIERCLQVFADESRPPLCPQSGVVAPALQWPDSRVQYPKEPITAETLLRENRLFSCSMFRRACWKQVGGYDEHRRHYEDWEFWLRIVKAGWQVGVVREPMYHYCPREGSSSARMKPGDHEEYVRYIQEKHAPKAH